MTIANQTGLLATAIVLAAAVPATLSSARAQSLPLIAQVENKPFYAGAVRYRLGASSRQQRLRRPRVAGFRRARIKRPFGDSTTLGGVFGISTGR